MSSELLLNVDGGQEFPNSDSLQNDEELLIKHYMPKHYEDGKPKIFEHDVDIVWTLTVVLQILYHDTVWCKEFKNGWATATPPPMRSKNL